MERRVLSVLFIGLLISTSSAAQDSVEALVERGSELFNADIGCWVCHGETAEGLVGPTLHFGPTPVDIFDQLENNPMMGVIVAEMNPSDTDLEAIAMYVRTLADLPLDIGLVQGWRDALAAVRANQAEEQEFAKTPRDLQVEAVETFASVQETWTRRSIEGSVWSEYPSRIVARWDPGEPKFTPEPGKTYFYENVGTTSSPSVLFDGYQPPPSNQLVVGDAQTMEIIATHMIPEQLRAVVHTSAMSPDGKYAYMVGPREPTADGTPDPAGAWTMLKLDAITLQPVLQVTIGARLHHGQVFRDKVLFDVFVRDQDGLGLFLYDPETDEILGGVRDVDMGGLHLHRLDRQGLRIHLRADGARRLRPGAQHGHAGRPDDVPGKFVGHAAFLGRHHRSGDLGGRRRVSHPGLPPQLGRHRQRQGVHLSDHEQFGGRQGGYQDRRDHLDQRHRHRALRRGAQRGRD